MWQTAVRARRRTGVISLVVSDFLADPRAEAYHKRRANQDTGLELVPVPRLPGIELSVMVGLIVSRASA